MTKQKRYEEKHLQKKKTMKQKDGSQTSDFKLALVSRFADIRLGACAFFVPELVKIDTTLTKNRRITLL